eukprot:3789297-Rhodomonas_salina.1
MECAMAGADNGSVGARRPVPTDDAAAQEQAGRGRSGRWRRGRACEFCKVRQPCVSFGEEKMPPPSATEALSLQMHST